MSPYFMCKNYTENLLYLLKIMLTIRIPSEKTEWNKSTKCININLISG